MTSMSTVAAPIRSAASHFPSPSRTASAHTARAFTAPSSTSLIASPTVPEKNPMPRAISDGFGTTVSAAMGALVTGARVGPEGRGERRAPPAAELADLESDALLGGDERLPRRGRAGALRRPHPRSAEVLPDTRHLRDVGHRDAAGRRCAEGLQVLVLDLRERLQVRGRAVVCEREGRLR